MGIQMTESTLAEVVARKLKRGQFYVQRKENNQAIVVTDHGLESIDIPPRAILGETVCGKWIVIDDTAIIR